MSFRNRHQRGTSLSNVGVLTIVGVSIEAFKVVVHFDEAETVCFIPLNEELTGTAWFLS